MLGAGTVGRAVIDALLRPGRRRDASTARDSAAARWPASPSGDLDRPASVGTARPALLTDAPAHLVADPDIDVIVEVMGGDEPAADADRRGARGRQAGRHRQQARHRPPRPGARGDRPAAGRAVPLRGRGRRRHPGPVAARPGPRRQRVTRVRGIVNGTTNHILTAMAHEGRPYDDVLRGRPGARLRRGRPERRRRGRRRGQQAGHPGPPGVRAVARPGHGRAPSADGARRRRGRASPASPTSSWRAPRRSA